MVKKKFYTIFNRIDNLQFYFEHLKKLFELNVQVIANKCEEEEKRKEQRDDNQRVSSLLRQYDEDEEERKEH